MKNLKITFALTFVVGLLSVSEAFACQFPGQNNLAGSKQTVTAPKGGSVITPSLADSSLKIFTKRDLVGRYSSKATATFFDPTQNRVAFATCVGLITFDGRGNLFDREVHSYDGFIVHDEFTGTYTMNPDGTGIMHFSNADESYDYSFVMSDDGREITFLILLDEPGVVSDGILKKQ